MGGDGGFAAAALPVDDTDMLGHAEASSSILSKPFIASSAWSTRLAAAAPDQPRQKCSAASKLRRLRPCTWGRTRARKGAMVCKSLRRPSEFCSRLSCFDSLSVSIFGARAWNRGSPAYLSLFAAMRVRCQSSSVPQSLGPLLQELRMQRPDARDG